MPGVVLTAAAIGAGAGALGLTTFAVAGSTALGGALLYGGFAATNYLLTRSSVPTLPETGPLVAPARQLQVASSGPAYWILGRARTYGRLVWWHDDGMVADYVLALSEGPCDELERVWVGAEEVPITLGTNAYAGSTYHVPPASSEYSGKLELWFYEFGVPGTAPASLAAVDGTYWSTAHAGVGMSFVHVRLTQPDYGEDLEQRFWTQIPSLSMLVRGLRITWPGQSTPTWTDNAAAIRYWFERERRGRPVTAFDDLSVQAAVTACGETIRRVPSDYFEHDNGIRIDLDRYTVNGILSSDDSHERVAEELDWAWQGTVAERDGLLLFFPGLEIPDSQAKTLDIDATMVRFLGARPAPSLQDRVNAASCTLAQGAPAGWACCTRPISWPRSAAAGCWKWMSTRTRFGTP